MQGREKRLVGLQELRWYCQVCERQLRNENAFKQHTLSEQHVRTMAIVAENPKAWVENYSRQFQSSFLSLLRTSHGEKPIHLNRFYQECISDKSHIRLNAIKWQSLSGFAKQMGREGLCRVEERDDGIFISWIDNSPETIRRRDAIGKSERSRRSEEVRTNREMQEQVERAQAANKLDELEENNLDEHTRILAVDEDRSAVKIPMALTKSLSEGPSASAGLKRKSNVFATARKAQKHSRHPIPVLAE